MRGPTPPGAAPADLAPGPRPGRAPPRRQGRPMRKRGGRHDITSPDAYWAPRENSAPSPGNAVASRRRPVTLRSPRRPSRGRSPRRCIPAGSGWLLRAALPGTTRASGQRQPPPLCLHAVGGLQDWKHPPSTTRRAQRRCSLPKRCLGIITGGARPLNTGFFPWPRFSTARTHWSAYPQRLYSPGFHWVV